MAWYHNHRERLRAPYGEYRPKRHSVTIFDTYDQRRLEAAALAIQGDCFLGKFFLFCADFTIRRHPALRRLHRDYEAERKRLAARREAEDSAAKQTGAGQGNHRGRKSRARQRRRPAAMKPNGSPGT